MPEVTGYAAGVPSWVDLQTTDPDGARAFYGALLGWDFEVGPPETGHYTNCRVRGHLVAGMVGTPQHETPTAWTTYLASDDVDATLRQAAEAGGTVAIETIEIMDQGRMGGVIDPTGAFVGLWEARAHVGATLVNEPGCVTWNELATRDLDAAQRFYGALFPYDFTDEDTGGGGPRYRTFHTDGDVRGGMLGMDANWPEGVPAHWSVYFSVADTDAAVSSAERLGATVHVPPTDSTYGRFAVLTDPQGAAFTVMRSTEPG